MATICTACNLSFSGVTAFDMHRTGSFSERTRRCLVTEEMKAKGMELSARNQWSTGLPAPVFSSTYSQEWPSAEKAELSHIEK